MPDTGSLHAENIGWIRWELKLPPGCARSRSPLPFVVCMDAQNQWTNQGSYGGWHTDSIVRSLIARRKLPPVALLGVHSPPRRDRTYAPPPGGGAGLLAYFIADTLIPALRDRFRLATRRDRIGIIGASFGANFALEAGLFRPDVFGLVGCFSAAPHYGESLHAMVGKRDRLPMHRLYVDAGTLWAYDNPHGFGGDSTRFNRDLVRLCAKRLPAGRFRGRIWKGHYHNEEFWRKRVGPALRFLFG